MAQTMEITENVPSNNKSYVRITFTAASISYHHCTILLNTADFIHTLCKVKVQFSLSTPWRHIGGSKVQLHSFIALAL